MPEGDREIRVMSLAVLVTNPVEQTCPPPAETALPGKPEENALGRGSDCRIWAET
jgi:hypothetical protein